ncbi:MAG: hypothetical protein K5985_11630 [Lachnospiraceae bacterium]|nr:hypothetical protein [Lachnospiraceae bacterium]
MTYRPPEGYIFDPDTGLYYSQVIAADAAGRRSQVVTWFDCDTGEYRQEIFSLESSAALRPDTVIARLTPAAPPRAESTEHGKIPPKKNPVWLFVIPAVLVMVLAVFAVVLICRHIKNTADTKKEDTVEVEDRTIDQSTGETGADDHGPEEIPAEQEPEEAEEAATEIAEEVIQETDSAETVEYTESGLPNCYGVDEDELLKANFTIIDVTTGNKYANGEMVDWFYLSEMGESGITKLFFHTESLNNDSDVMEYLIDVTPMGSRFSRLYDRDCIETKVRGGGLEITFYVFLDGSTEVDAQSEVIDENEHAGYEGFGFGRGLPGDYYLM